MIKRNKIKCEKDVTQQKKGTECDPDDAFRKKIQGSQRAL